MLPRVALALVLLPFALPAPALSAPQQVEPGVSLTGALTLVEHPSTGSPTATTMHASKVGSNAHTGSNIAKGLVYAGQRHTVEIDGLTSSLVLTTNTPTFYVHIDPEDPNDQRAMFTLVRLQQAKDTRVAISFSANTFGGGQKRHVEEVLVSKTDAGHNILKMTPQSPLQPGEYGLLMLPEDTKVFPDRIYDFTVPAPAK